MIKYYFLKEDLLALERQVSKLRSKLKELGKDQGEANRQSTENFGHDDACQEAIYQDRSVLVTRLNNLSLLLKRAVVVDPIRLFTSVRLGAVVELDDGRKIKIGSYETFAEYSVQTISYNSPLGRALIGKAVGDEVRFRDQKLKIIRIS